MDGPQNIDLDGLRASLKSVEHLLLRFTPVAERLLLDFRTREGVGPGVHLCRTPAWPGQASRPAGAGQCQRVIVRTAVGHDDARRHLDPRQVTEQSRQVVRFVDRRDHHPEGGPAHGSMSFSVQSYSKKRTSTPGRPRNSASSSGK